MLEVLNFVYSRAIFSPLAYLCVGLIDGINIRIHETISNTYIEYINVSILLHDRTKAIGVSLALWPKEH